MNALVERRVLEVQNFIESGYENYLAQVRNKAITAKEDLKKLIAENPDKKEFHFITTLYTICEGLIFCPDKEILGMLKQAGLKAPDLKWLVPLEELEKEFTAIENGGLVIDKIRTLICIQLYISTQLLNTIFLRFAETVNHDNTVWNPLVKTMYDAYNRAKYAQKKGKVPGDEETVAVQEMVPLFGEAFGKPAKRKLVTDLFQGKTEHHILVQILDFIKPLHLPLSKRKKLVTCFELFELICKDGLLGEEDKLIKRSKYQILIKYLFKK